MEKVKQFLSDLWTRIDEYYQVNYWLDGDGRVAAEVPEADRRMIRLLGYAELVVIVFIYACLLTLSVGGA